MSKYLALYCSEAAADGPSVAEMFANTPPEQLQAGMAAWTAWYEKYGASIVDGGAPLDRPSVVTPSDVTPGTPVITGYTVVSADSKEQATAMFKDHPHLFMPGATVQVLEFVSMPGM